MKTLANILFAAMAAVAIALCAECGEKENEVFVLSDFPVNPHPADLDTIPHQYVGELGEVCGVISKDPNISFGGSHICVHIPDGGIECGYKSVYLLSRIIPSDYEGKTIKISGNLYWAMGHPGLLNMIAYVYVLTE